MKVESYEYIPPYDRRGNSGGSWDPSSQKISELAENNWQYDCAKLKD